MTPIKLHPCSFFFILDQRLAVNCCFPQMIILILILITKLACYDPGGVRGTIINGLKSIYQICLLQTGLYGEQACSKRGPFTDFRSSLIFWLSFGKNVLAQSISKIETLLKEEVWQLISRVWKISGHRYQRPKALVSDHPSQPCSMSFHKSVFLQNLTVAQVSGFRGSSFPYGLKGKLHSWKKLFQM